jgi:cysteine protease ATG4
MMLAQALVSHTLGNDWRWETASGGGGGISAAVEDRLRGIVALFGDAPQWPFSIHAMTRVGKRLGKTGTEWYGPATAALVLRDLVACAKPAGLTARVAQDGTVYADAMPIGVGQQQQPFVLFVPLRLGLDAMNPVYCRSLAALFMLPQSIGVVGGRPRSSLYFVAAQGASLYYLDPHIIQPYVPIPPAANHFDISSWQCQQPARRMLAVDIDPSMTAGFYFRDAADFTSFREQIARVPQDEQLFSIQDHTPHSPLSRATCVTTFSDEEAEFEKI